MAQTKTKRTGKNAPNCDHCQMQGLLHDHKMIDKHRSYCAHRDLPGHHMSFCYKLKFCNLCCKAGHNPYRCWQYGTITKWLFRAEELHMWAVFSTFIVVIAQETEQRSISPLKALKKPKNLRQKKIVTQFNKVKQSYRMEKLS